jgi:hypothetical protein
MIPGIGEYDISSADSPRRGLVLSTVGDRPPLASSEGGNRVATAGADEDDFRKEVLRHWGKQGNVRV